MSKVFLVLMAVISTCCGEIKPLPETYKKEIKELVKNNHNQLSVREYSMIAQTIYQKSPCNVLVFGVGKDTPLWLKVNNQGHTVFIEDNGGWLDSVKKQIPNLDAILVKYNTLRIQ